MKRFLHIRILINLIEMMFKRRRPKTIVYKGTRLIRYGKGYIDPEDHGGLTGKPTMYYLKRRKRRK